MSNLSNETPVIIKKDEDSFDFTFKRPKKTKNRWSMSKELIDSFNDDNWSIKKKIL